MDVMVALFFLFFFCQNRVRARCLAFFMTARQFNRRATREVADDPFDCKKCRTIRAMAYKYTIDAVRCIYPRNDVDYAVLPFACVSPSLPKTMWV